jgi:predicted ABC-type exoprotein transport system permease subunit
MENFNVRLILLNILIWFILPSILLVVVLTVLFNSGHELQMPEFFTWLYSGYFYTLAPLACAFTCTNKSSSLPMYNGLASIVVVSVIMVSIAVFAGNTFPLASVVATLVFGALGIYLAIKRKSF